MAATSCSDLQPNHGRSASMGFVLFGGLRSSGGDHFIQCLSVNFPALILSKNSGVFLAKIG